MKAPPSHSYRLAERLHSCRNALSLWIAERVRWSAGVHRETAALTLDGIDGAQRARIDALGERYQVRFESEMSRATSLNNYEYLDLLDAAMNRPGTMPPAGLHVHDVGCASFWYARALERFFRPACLVGFETEGYRRYLDGHTRADHARGYLRELPAARFEIGDYRHCEQPAGIITAWFPFLTAGPLLAWGLRLSDLDPLGLMQRIACNLTPGGLYFMVNHGAEEFALAAALCERVGMRLENRLEYRASFRPRARPAVASCWRYSDTSCILRRGS